MKVLGLCAAPEISASTRCRMAQYVEPLRRRGIDLDVRPFLSSEQFAKFYENTRTAPRLGVVAGPLIRRFFDALDARNADLIFVQREALFFGPAIFEWLARRLGRTPMVLDLDDAVHIPYRSERYGRLGTALKFFGKTDALIRASRTVICGGRPLAEYVERLGAKSVVIPTVVDPTQFAPREVENERPVVGWIGTESTAPFLRSIVPAIRNAASRHECLLRVRGAGDVPLGLEGLDADVQPWRLETEIEDFRSIDIGLYPLVETDAVPRAYLEGKSGFKAVQYLTLGIPYIVSPVGVAAEIGVPGVTHLEAENEEEWETALDKLLSAPELRTQMGAAGRKHALQNYDLETWADAMAEVLRASAS